MPEKKSEIVKKFQSQNKCVCFIGDGINDTIALNSADVSISFSGASSAASDSAHIVMLSGNFTNLAGLFELSHDLMRDLKTNLVLSISPAVMNIMLVFALPNYSILSAILLKFSLRSLAIGNAMLPLIKKVDKKL